MRGGLLAASTTGRHVALSLLFGGPYLHINYFIIVIGIVIKLLNIKVNKKRIGLVNAMQCNGPQAKYYIFIQHKIVAFIILPHLY
jgi:hypothetical protein